MKYQDGNLHIRARALQAIYYGEDGYILDHPEYWEEDGFTEEDSEELTAVLERFEVADEAALENEDFYQGMNYIFVLRRKADGACFGVSYFYMGGKHGESQFDNSIEWETGMYELRPVEAHSIPTFRFKDTK